MAQRIKSFNPLQVGKVMGVMYTLVGLLLVPFFWLGFAAAPPGAPTASGVRIGVGIVLPFAYGLMGFIFAALGAWLYNQVSRWTGGIEVELEQTTPA